MTTFLDLAKQEAELNTLAAKIEQQRKDELSAIKNERFTRTATVAFKAEEFIRDLNNKAMEEEYGGIMNAEGERLLRLKKPPEGASRLQKLIYRGKRDFWQSRNSYELNEKGIEYLQDKSGNALDPYLNYNKEKVLASLDKIRPDAIPTGVGERTIMPKATARNTTMPKTIEGSKTAQAAAAPTEVAGETTKAGNAGNVLGKIGGGVQIATGILGALNANKAGSGLSQADKNKANAKAAMGVASGVMKFTPLAPFSLGLDAVNLLWR